MSDVTIIQMGTCDVYWGSHGCDKDRGHLGRHVCRDEGGDECEAVDRNGVDESGFHWHLYGNDVPDPCEAPCGSPEA